MTLTIYHVYQVYFYIIFIISGWLGSAPGPPVCSWAQDTFCVKVFVHVHLSIPVAYLQKPRQMSNLAALHCSEVWMSMRGCVPNAVYSCSIHLNFLRSRIIRLLKMNVFSNVMHFFSAHLNELTLYLCAYARNVFKEEERRVINGLYFTFSKLAWNVLDK